MALPLTEEESKAVRLASKTYRDALILPYLNVETLKDDPTKLIALLRYRADYAPENWVTFDAEAMKEEFDHGAIANAWNKNCVVMFGTDYGKLVSFNKEQCHRWNYIGFPRAIIVLEAQEVLLGFLRRTVDILTMENSTESGNSLWLSMPNAFSQSGEIEAWAPSSNQAFSAPQRFDPVQCLKKAESLLAAAEDEFRFLQTDPQFMHELIARQLRGEHLACLSSEKTWRYIAVTFFADAVCDFQTLQSLVEECSHVLDVFHGSPVSLEPGAAVPEEHDRALWLLESLTSDLYYTECIRLMTMLRESPSFRSYIKYFETPRGMVGGTLRSGPDFRATNAWCFQNEPLLWALSVLGGDPAVAARMTVPMLIGFIDHHLTEASRKDRSKIDQTMYNLLSRMTLFWEISTTLRSTRRNSSIAIDQIHPTTADNERRTWKAANRMPPLFSNDDMMQAGRLLKYSYEKKFPVGKYDQNWLHTAKDSRAALAEFWKHVAQMWRRRIGNIGWPNNFVESEIAWMCLAQSEEHLSEVRLEEEEVAKFLEASLPSEHTITQGIQPPQTIWGEPEPALPSISSLSLRKKVKSRPTTVVTGQIQTVIQPGKQQHNQSVIKVKAESLRILLRLFPSTNEKEFKGKINWQQFVSAMVDAGCSAMHNGGSAVTFGNVQNVNDGKEGTIVFHKPHPNRELELPELRINGKRLRRRFGWNPEVFVERG
jgi:hypothetical protein